MNENLMELGELDFDDALGDSLNTLARFAPFLEPGVIHRTVENLGSTRDAIDAQLVRWGDGKSDDPEWESKAKSRRALVSSRLHTAQARVRKSDVNKNFQISQWKRFAHRLAEALNSSNNDIALDDIQAPYGDITAGEWLDRRLEKNPKRTGVNA